MQNGSVLRPIDCFDSTVVSKSKFFYTILLDMRMAGFFDRPYLNDLTEICQPGDRVKVVFFTKISDRTEELGQQLILLNASVLRKPSEHKLTKAEKVTTRKLQRQSRKKPAIQRFEGVVVASKWVRPLEILELNPLRDFEMVLSLRRFLFACFFDIIVGQQPQALKQFRDMREQIFTTVPHLPPRSQVLTVRKILRGVSSEKTFCVNSPWVKSVERVYSSHVRRAKLYYLRGRTVKGARLKRRTNFVPSA
jgi:ribosomal protein L19